MHVLGISRTSLFPFDYATGVPTPQAYMHICAHMCTCAYTDQLYTQYRHRCASATCIHAYMRTHVHRPVAFTILSQMYQHLLAQHAHTHVYTNKHKHTHTHIHTQLYTRH